VVLNIPGAHVNQLQNYTTHRLPNVFGTIEILRLACAKRQKYVYYVSTLSIFTQCSTIKEADTVDVQDPRTLNGYEKAIPFEEGFDYYRASG
jgi:thioester reductase-like protein